MYTKRMKKLNCGLSPESAEQAKRRWREIKSKSVSQASKPVKIESKMSD